MCKVLRDNLVPTIIITTLALVAMTAVAMGREVVVAQVTTCKQLLAAPLALHSRIYK